MPELVFLGLGVVTSFVAYVIGRGVLGLSPSRLPGAVARSLELLGMSTLFLVVNIAVGLLAILALRATSPFFISVYVLDDGALMAISFFQGLIFDIWRTRQRAG